MKKIKPEYTFVALGVGVIFATGFLIGKSVTKSDQRSILDETVSKLNNNSSFSTDKDSLERAAIDGMLRSLGDKWSQYLPASGIKSFASAIEGQYTGIGIWLRLDESGYISIAGIVPSTPADFAKLEVGDVIQSIDGTSTVNKSLSEISSLLTGLSGTTASLVVQRSNETLNFELIRQGLNINPIDFKILSNGVIVFKINEFSRGTARLLRASLAADPSERIGIVLDIRGNPGGLLVEAVDVASAFLSGGEIVEFYKSGGEKETFNAQGNGDTKTPIVVLVDSGTASAAEILAAALQERNRAIIVGSKTFGKGTVQNITTLSDGSAIELTAGYYLTPSGKRIDGMGIDPDILVESTLGEDLAEEKALQVLAGLIASAGSWN